MGVGGGPVECVRGQKCWWLHQVTLLSPSSFQIADLTTELADERFKGDVACQVLESERAERLRAFREVQELKVSGPECWRAGVWMNRLCPVLASGIRKPR